MIRLIEIGLFNSKVLWRPLLRKLVFRRCAPAAPAVTGTFLLTKTERKWMFKLFFHMYCTVASTEALHSYALAVFS